MDTHVIYGLHLESDPTIRYVGYTTVGIDLRMKRHRNDSRNLADTRRVYNWMRKHGSDSVTAMILEVCPEGDMEFLSSREIHWISFYKMTTDDLLNHSSGGKGGNSGYKHTPEAVAKISENSRKQYELLGDEHPLAKQKGELHPMFGRKHSQESLQKMSDSLKGRPLSAEHKEKLRVKRPSTAGALHWSKTPEGKITMARGHHKTHHVNKNITKPECTFCTDD